MTPEKSGQEANGADLEGAISRPTASRPFALYYEGKGETVSNRNAAPISAGIRAGLAANRQLAVLENNGYRGIYGCRCVWYLAGEGACREEHDGEGGRCDNRFHVCLLQRLCVER